MFGVGAYCEACIAAYFWIGLLLMLASWTTDKLHQVYTGFDYMFIRDIVDPDTDSTVAVDSLFIFVMV